MLPSDTKLELEVLDQLFFNNTAYPKTAAIYAAICSEVKRLWTNAQGKAKKISEACKNAEKYCIKVIWYDKEGTLESKPEKDDEIAGYLLAFTREPLKIQRKTLFSSSISQSWINVSAYAIGSGLIPPGASIDIFLNGVDMKIKSAGKAPDTTFSLINLTPNFPEFLKATSAIDSEYKSEGDGSQPMRHIKGFESRFPDENMKFNVVGCQGVSGLNFLERTSFYNKQQEVAKHMNSNDARFNILLGDNIYNDGVKVPNEKEGFDVNFHKIYNKFSFVILGNHDYGIGGGVSLSGGGSLAPWNKATEQINHTRTANNWYMPHRYYAVVGKHAIFYCIDSNTYVFDDSQQKWLKGTAEFLQKTYKDRWHILCSHHPLESYGKRGMGDVNNPGDEFLRSKEEEQGGKRKSISQQTLPLTPRRAAMLNLFPGVSQSSSSSAAIADIEEEPSNVGEYASALCIQTCAECTKGKDMSIAIREQLIQDQINFDVVFAAHDHFFAAGMLLDENLFTFQAIVGCGGKRLQSVKFKKIVKEAHNGYSSSDIATFEEYGFLQVEINANIMRLDGINHNGQTFYKNSIFLEDFR